ncbi:uncharacterized protein BXZ73DRAFT_107391 [Epithele typhae]|uniref:uncharacterized protein n=1 Tax=Epithele typhae TaxID=378194 RepID=UPI002008AA92|nr:uncharacterized protein BXZ73DRAFT_107391 [Epithele typhae]KAH9912500.1 hypothetical protein BXZ73DRAFT_107391 [Epithele typhae]
MCDSDSPTHSVFDPSTDSSITASCLPSAKDEEFWYSDGTVVLIESSGILAFKVYHGLLARFSHVFREMLAFPAPSTAPSLHGVPVVHLSDSAHDLRHLLQVVFNKPMVQGRQVTPAPQSVSFDHISAVIRLAHKYQMDDILEDALAVLRGYYTTRYISWTARADNILAATPSHAIDAVLLARLTDAHALLPTALMHCSALGPRVVHGHTRTDGTVVRLADADVVRALDGRAELLRRDSRRLRAITLYLVGEHPGVQGSRPDLSRVCFSREQCKAAMKHIWEVYFGKEARYETSDLRPWAEAIPSLGRALW